MKIDLVNEGVGGEKVFTILVHSQSLYKIDRCSPDRPSRNETFSRSKI